MGAVARKREALGSLKVRDGTSEEVFKGFDDRALSSAVVAAYEKVLALERNVEVRYAAERPDLN
jgi:hypothetical protein